MSQPVHVTGRDGIHIEVTWQEGETLMEALRDNGLPVLASCGGVRACATCHVYVRSRDFPNTGDLNEEEVELLSETAAYQKNASRLSCQIPYVSDLSGISVTLAPED